MILITGAGGLVGHSVANFFLKKNYQVFGIENNKRKILFGKEGSIRKNIINLKKNNKFKHLDIDINDNNKIIKLLKNKKFDLIIHAAAQPSHDWSASNPTLDFKINGVGTFNILESIRKYNKDSIFIFLSTNKVYGDIVNNFIYREKKLRFEIFDKFKNGFNENLSIDNSLHSPFGASKLSADIFTQEYGKYFNLKTICLRAGCLTGENHSGVELHGFLSYLFKCAFYKKKYEILGHKGKQVRDNLSSEDVAEIIYLIFKKAPNNGTVYNIGGGRKSNVSILEAIIQCEKLTKNKFIYSYSPKARVGDHKFWITDMTKFKKDYPSWRLKKNINNILNDMFEYEKFWSRKK